MAFIAESAIDGTSTRSLSARGQLRGVGQRGLACPDVATQWWQQASSQQSASIINVAADGTVTGISACLP